MKIKGSFGIRGDEHYGYNYKEVKTGFICDDIGCPFIDRETGECLTESWCKTRDEINENKRTK